MNFSPASAKNSFNTEKTNENVSIVDICIRMQNYYFHLQGRFFQGGRRFLGPIDVGFFMMHNIYNHIKTLTKLPFQISTKYINLIDCACANISIDSFQLKYYPNV